MPCRSSWPPACPTPLLRGILHPDFTEGAFWRALIIALVMTLIGAVYPTTRAALLTPLKALSYE